MKSAWNHLIQESFERRCFQQQAKQQNRRDALTGIFFFLKILSRSLGLAGSIVRCTSMAALVTRGGTPGKDDDGNDEKITANAMERFKKYFSVDKLLEKVQKHNLDSKKEMRPSTWSLYGKLYDTSNEEGERAFFADFRSHIWITYRCNFHALVPSPPTFPLTSDGGWGCMIRSGQMMLAEVLLRRQLGRDWRLDKPVRDSRNRSYSIAHKDVLTQFIDVPNVKCNFSIHRIVQVGLQYGKRPGIGMDLKQYQLSCATWSTPTTT